MSSLANKGNSLFLASRPEMLSSSQHPKQQSWKNNNPGKGHDLAHLGRLHRMTVSHWQGGREDRWNLHLHTQHKEARAGHFLCTLVSPSLPAAFASQQKSPCCSHIPESHGATAPRASRVLSPKAQPSGLSPLGQLMSQGSLQ